MKRIGVYPVWENKFKISTSGRANPNMVPIACLETFSVAVDTNIEEWSPSGAEGWLCRMATGKGLSIGMTGKRKIGDSGNDYVAGNAWKTGVQCKTRFEWEFPSGAKLEFDCILNVTNPGGGESRNVTPLEFEVLSDGKPVFIPKEDSNESGTDTPGGVRAYLYNIQDFSGKYVSRQDFSDYHYSNGDIVTEYAEFGVGEAPLTYTTEKIYTGTNSGSIYNPGNTVKFSLPEIIPAGAEVTIRYIFPEYTYDSPTAVCDKSKLHLALCTESIDATLVYLQNGNFSVTSTFGHSITIADDGLTAITNANGEIIGVEITGVAVADINEIQVGKSYWQSSNANYHDATVTAVFSSYDDIQITAKVSE